MALAVVAGLLAMHALGTGHAGMASADRHAGAHVHTDDHHGAEADPVVDLPAAAALPAEAALLAATALPAAAALPATAASTAAVISASAFPAASAFLALSALPAAALHAGTAPAGGHDQAGPAPCPVGTPGHCPEHPTLISMCQAVLTNAGLVLLLWLLLLLALAVRRSPWSLGARPLVAVSRAAWGAARRRLQATGPSLHELCVSRT